jgi:hypothetical protein
MTIQQIIYGSKPGTPPGIRRKTQMSRTTVTSILKQFASPRATPAMTLPFFGLTKRFIRKVYHNYIDKSYPHKIKP